MKRVGRRGVMLEEKGGKGEEGVGRIGVLL